MRKIGISILVLLISIGAVMCLVYWNTDQRWNIHYSVDPVTLPDTYESLKNKQEIEAKKTSELFNSAMRERNPALCEEITDTSKKSECHDIVNASIAQEAGNIKTCASLASAKIASLCHDTISADQAIRAKDSSICDTLTNSGRILGCREQIDEIILSEHISAKTVTKVFCASLSEKYQTKCLGEIQENNESAIYKNAILENDPELCQSISNPELKDTCRDTIYLKTAITTHNNKLCESIRDNTKKTYCTTQVSQNDDIAKYKSAIQKNNLEICASINTPHLRNKCHDTIVITLVKTRKDIDLCDTLSSTGMIASCKNIGF